MNIVKILLFCCLAPSIVIGNPEPQTSVQPSMIQAPVVQDLPLYKETEHFAFFCQPVDNQVTDTIAAQCESYFTQLSADFDHIYSAKITFKIYPNIVAFHEAIGKPDAPDWVCSGEVSEEHLCRLVSPNNPGSYHTFDFMMGMPPHDLAKLFINDTYKNDIPRWLYMGVGLYKSSHMDYCIWEKNLAKNVNQLPTLQQLKDSPNILEFSKIEGYLCGYSLVKFLDKQWGWETTKKLLADYTSFESILGITEEQFRIQWIEYLLKEYGAENKPTTT